MNRFVFITITSLLLASQGESVLADANPYEKELAKHWDLFDDYCIDCHNFDDMEGGFSFEPLWPDAIADEAKLWEEVIRKLNTGMMPPPGEKRPATIEVSKLVKNLENALDYEASINPNPGSVVLHRLNRNEYTNAIRDMLGLNLDASELLPRDDESHGFTNNAGVLKISPSFLEQSLLAAREISSLALGDINSSANEIVFPAPASAGQYVHIDGLPLGTRGGMLIEHNFPAAGEYELSIKGLVGAVYLWGVLDENTLLITLDGKKVFQQNLGGIEDLRAVDLEQASAVSRINERFGNIPVSIAAGPHRIGVTFLAKTAAESNEILHSFVPVTGMSVEIQGNSYGPKINNLTIKGPLSNKHLNTTPSREHIFSCYPTKESDAEPCAENIISSIAGKAFRRPITTEEMAALVDFYHQGYQQGGFEKGIQNSLIAILASPKFLYRSTSPNKFDSGDRHSIKAISDIDLASRLSFFLWSSLPDQTLINLAEEHRLSEPAILKQQITRMLKDKRSGSLVSQFAFQWLNIQGLEQLEPDPTLFPQYTADLSDDFATELFLFINSIFSQDRSVTELLSSPQSFVNERLALHYGLKNIRGGKFRRIEWQDDQRHGLLGKGAILMTTSYSNRTSPVVRGAYILEKFLGTPPPAPPPDVEAFPENKIGAEIKTVRERLEMHRENPSCNSCHAIIDPLGLALENYNALGQWRLKDEESGSPIDASGQLIDGTALNSPVDLKNALLHKPERFVQTFTENLMTFALGRGVEYYDMPSVRKIVRNAKQDNYQLSSIVAGIVLSPAFLQDKKASQ